MFSIVPRVQHQITNHNTPTHSHIHTQSTPAPAHRALYNKTASDVLEGTANNGKMSQHAAFSFLSSSSPQRTDALVDGRRRLLKDFLRDNVGGETKPLLVPALTHADECLSSTGCWVVELLVEKERRQSGRE